MLSCAAKLDIFRTRADDFGQRRLGVQLSAELIEIGDFQLRAQAHLTRVGFQLAQNQPQQSGLAAAVGAD